mmetsp:Transcript_31274/g.28435  ORF Transcript_31274/g.28435 Transcript_31274/m.28435 type:complete len:153 (+) Transcript_31274:1222-1680(+)|eukprot:CAMPEP_0114599902 /NCGR_PEP_ID=MMETSP0125-20121206/22405_1 /TAXON_ID=485358 ORGANISM="Aristerostoma sp., Strain ATCC 50986" /NCGR_SAMPLE_ID=MMETSP0125 /ASSEMBLY_ACC=CAM_ASM_000245 /LENGTH=152 /DNA_ID=CAMNT_0001807363 /DNA_START=1873 /DNA_END=2331 /DNA_ORIENTATION=+
MAIKTGFRVPDGLLLAYPALDLEIDRFTPSFLQAIEDQLLPYSVLKLCLKAYVPDGASTSKDCFISPLRAPDDFLKLLPPTRIVVGTRDPLHDECWRFADRMRELGKDMSMIVYKELPHAFLSFDVPMGMPEAKECINDSVKIFKELFAKAK